MFESRIKHPVHLPSLALLVSGLVALVWLQSPPPEVAAAMVAPPPVAVEAPPEPAPAQPEPAVIGTTCVADVTTVGAPLGEPFDYDEVLAGALIEPDGCTIAAWTKDRLFVSWDGGATFATYQVGGAIGSVAVTRGRVAMVRDGNALGTVRAGDHTAAWHELGVLSGGPEPYELVLSVAGRWTLAYRYSEQLLAVTDDDGATWRHPTPPKPAQFWVTEDGRTWARHLEVIDVDPDADEPVDDRTEHYVAAAGTSTWRNADAAVRKTQRGWTYQVKSDQSWGCGGTVKIIALHHGREVGTVVNELHPQVFSPEIVSRGDVTFAMYRAYRTDDEAPERLFRLRGTRSIDLGELPFLNVAHLVGVDRYDTLIAFDGGSVLRWSEGGGWRRLWSVPMAPGF
jgi:hypothetical protein